jgi:hypothetical protein
VSPSALPAPADVDPRLLMEALRRACERRLPIALDRQAALAAILAEARRGARDLYTLARAAESVAAATSAKAA